MKWLRLLGGLFGRSRLDSEDKTPKDFALMSPEEQEIARMEAQDSDEFEVPAEMQTEDLPPSVRRNKGVLRSLRRGDLKAKEFYRSVDNHIEQLREVRQQIESKKK